MRAQRLSQFEVAPRIRVQPHDAVFAVDRDLGKAADQRALCLRDILEQSAADARICAVFGDAECRDALRGALL